jgi:hypothetical protein
MQDVIEELIRGVGYLALRLVTLGRYHGGRAGDRLPEGALGFVLVVALVYAAYALVSK